MAGKRGRPRKNPIAEPVIKENSVYNTVQSTKGRRGRPKKVYTKEELDNQKKEKEASSWPRFGFNKITVLSDRKACCIEPYFSDEGNTKDDIIKLTVHEAALELNNFLKSKGLPERYPGEENKVIAEKVEEENTKDELD